MIILHHSNHRNLEDEKETNEALKEVRKKYKVIDITCDNQSALDELFYEYWGKDDIISIQGDVVMPLEIVDELVNCKISDWCMYGHEGYNHSGIIGDHIGSMKIPKRLMDQLDPRIWYRKGYESGAPLWTTLDSRITGNLQRLFRAPHDHTQMTGIVLKHNHLI